MHTEYQVAAQILISIWKRYDEIPRSAGVLNFLDNILVTYPVSRGCHLEVDDLNFRSADHPGLQACLKSSPNL